jgi:hypothetical protein
MYAGRAGVTALSLLVLTLPASAALVVAGSNLADRGAAVAYAQPLPECSSLDGVTLEGVHNTPACENNGLGVGTLGTLDAPEPTALIFFLASGTLFLFRRRR